MTAPKQEIATSFSEYANLVEQYRKGSDSPLWFRGVGAVSHKLIPSIFRHPSILTIEGLVELENNILTRFRHRSIPYQTRPLDHSWELMFVMQHFGVPTRLLDWSENPFVALYFAITAAEEMHFAEDAAVWILNTREWNGKVLTPYWKGRILAIPDSPLDGYVPGADLAKLAGLPVAMAGLHNSPRIVAQRGAFTVFGHINLPMEQLFDQNAFPEAALIKIVLPMANMRDIRESLFGIGYADSMIYPDLGGLAKELKRQFGFVGV